MSEKSNGWYKDWRFWLLLYIINISGNLGFSILFNDRILTIIAFMFVSIMSILKSFPKKCYLTFIIPYILLLGIPMTYLGNEFSWNSYIHITIKIVTGALTLGLIGHKFIHYYVDIIVGIAVISLVCFGLNCAGFVIPFISIEKTTIDGGNIYRVSSLIYTQLYNGELTLRNCGIFWEPGAFQGFLNLAIAFIVFGPKSLSKRCFLHLLILCATVLTTSSTGGFIVLGCLIFIYIIRRRSLSPLSKATMLLGFIMICAYLYNNLDFLSSKVSSDTARTGVSINDLGSDLFFWFGYSYSNDALFNSDIKTASAILGLLRYSGVVGFIFFLGKLFIVRQLPQWNLLWGMIIVLILMNEPFLTVGPFWWCSLFLWKFIDKKNFIVKQPIAVKSAFDQ